MLTEVGGLGVCGFSLSCNHEVIVKVLVFRDCGVFFLGILGPGVKIMPLLVTSLVFLGISLFAPM